MLSVEYCKCNSHPLSGMSVFRLESDFRFFENKGKWHKIISNIVISLNSKISIVFKGRLDSDKWLDNPSLNTGSKHLNQFRLSSD